MDMSEPHVWDNRRVGFIADLGRAKLVLLSPNLSCRIACNLFGSSKASDVTDSSKIGISGRGQISENPTRVSAKKAVFQSVCSRSSCQADADLRRCPRVEIEVEVVVWTLRSPREWRYPMHPWRPCGGSSRPHRPRSSSPMPFAVLPGRSWRGRRTRSRGGATAKANTEAERPNPVGPSRATATPWRVLPRQQACGQHPSRLV
jgi:hypothetical protein